MLNTKEIALGEKMYKDLTTKYNPIDKPKHYNEGNIEAIEAIKASMTHEEYIGHLKASVLKYLWRYRYKSKPLEDLKKSAWYLNRLIKEIEVDQTGK